MIEELEAEAVTQLLATEGGKSRPGATLDHRGTPIEVRARRRNDGGVVLGYSFGGVRLERAVLLLLICPESACERSQSAKRQWGTLNPPSPPPRQRRSRSPLKGVPPFKATHLHESVPVEVGDRKCDARPALFNCMTACPVQAHVPRVMHKEGWDLFEGGKCVAGGLRPDPVGGGLLPLFPSIEAARVWLMQQEHEASSRVGS